MIFGPRLALAIILAGSSLVGCQPRVDIHGFMPNATLVEQVKLGELTRAGVAEVLGSPSTIATFDADTWYYITQKTRSFAFLKPEIVDQEVLVIKFDDRQVVSAVEHYTIEDGLIIDPVTRKTPTVGKELTFLQQLFGNIGRFAK